MGKTSDKNIIFPKEQNRSLNNLVITILKDYMSNTHK